MIKEQFSRNLGIMTEIEVQKLHDTTISIAGCGCIGGFSAELLARMGVGKLVLADPDVFDVSNINRQCAATHLTIGQRKAEALKAHLLTINPDMQITCYNEGVNENNVSLFVEGADYVIDAIDYFAFPEAVALHRAARLKNLFITTAVALGFGTSVMTFSPTGLKLEEYVGVPKDMSIEDLRGQTFPPALYSQNLPDYATDAKITEWLKDRSIPTISVGQALGPGVLVSKLVLHLLNRKDPKIIPDYFQLNLE